MHHSTSVRHERWAIAAVLLVAAVLRVTGLGWGLRHAPIRDEMAFVENAARMWADRTLDHGYYLYPGLFFELLSPVVGLAPRSAPYVTTWDGFAPRTVLGPTGYLTARALVAAFGVLSVALVHRLGRRIGGPLLGLAAASFLAVSPVEVFVAHEVRPDVALEAFVLLALLACLRVGERGRNDFVAGLALGAAAGVKFTGVLVVPSYLVVRALAPGRRTRGALLAVLGAATVWVLSTPYALLAPHDFFRGGMSQLNFHYRAGPAETDLVGNALFYLRTIGWSLGPIGAFLAGLGLWTARREPLRWWPALTYLVLLVVVLSTADMHWHRLVLSGLGVASLLAAAGIVAVVGRYPRLGWGVLAAGILLPAAASVEYLRTIVTPGTRDAVLDWVDASLPRGGRVLTTVHELGLDRSRFEVIEETGSEPLDRRLAREVDLVVWHRSGDAPLAGLQSVWRGEPRTGGGGFGEMPEAPLSSLDHSIVLYRVPAGESNRYQPVPLTPAMASASSNGADAGKAVDGRRDTAWVTESSQDGREWFQLVWPTPVRVGRVELRLGTKPKRYGANLRVAVTADGERWTVVPSASGRPPVPQQIGRDSGDASQVVVLEPTLTRGIRIAQGGTAPRQWGFAEIEVERRCRRRPRGASAGSSLPPDRPSLVLFLEPRHEGLEVVDHGAGREVLARGVAQDLAPVLGRPLLHDRPSGTRRPPCCRHSCTSAGPASGSSARCGRGTGTSGRWRSRRSSSRPGCR